EHKHVGVHRFRSPLPVWHAERPMLSGDIAQPTSEALALHLFTKDRFFPVVRLPSEFAGVVDKQMAVPAGRFLGDLEQFRRMNRLGLRVRPLPADAGVLLAAAR